MSKSIAFLKFKSLLEQEIRTFWHVIAALEYAERWLQASSPKRLTSSAGDDRYPFRAIDITPTEFVAEQAQVSSHIRENALVSFITAFEAYLYELLERLIYLDPSLVSDSDLQVQVKEIASAAHTADMKRWVATTVADKYLRNKTHAEMVKRLDRFCKASVATTLSAEILEWSRWSLVRNSIVHTSRQVTAELARAWPTRFPSSGAPISLQNKELARIHHLALTIAEAIDERAVVTVIKQRDALLIVRELFVQRGTADATVLKAVLSKVMRVNVTRVEIERALGQQRRGRHPDTWELSLRELDTIVP